MYTHTLDRTPPPTQTHSGTSLTPPPTNPYIHPTTTPNTQRLRNAQFLHIELPRRIAQRVVELRDQLPPSLVQKRGIQNVMGWYAGYVEELLNFPKPMDAEQEYDFTCLLASILCDHTSVPRALANGAPFLLVGWFVWCGRVCTRHTCIFLPILYGGGPQGPPERPIPDHQHTPCCHNNEMQ